MKKFLVLSAMILALPFTMNAQDDDMYFVPKKKSSVKAAKETYYSGSDRSTDEYNRRQKFEGSSVVPMDSTTMLARGLSPDSIYVDSHFAERLLQEYNENEDYRYSRELDRWYGVYDPWFYSRSIWAPYRHGWYNPWYGPSWAFYDPWYDPYYYGPAYFGWPSYSWYSPYYYGGWWPYYGGYYGWYDPWFYGGYYGYYGWGHIGGGGHKYPNSNGIAGTSNHGRVTNPNYAHNGGRFNGPRNGASGSASSFAGGRRSAAAATSSYSSAGSSMGASRSRSGFSSSMGGSRGNSGASMNSGSSTRTSSSSNTYRSTNTSSTPSYTTSHSSSFSSSSSSGASRSSGSSGGGSRSGGSFGGGRR